MAEGYEQQPLGIIPVYLGTVSNMNISNRKVGVIYMMNYIQSTNNTPVVNTSGYSFLFVNSDSTEYGRQIAISNSGIYTRNIAQNTYGSWSAIIQ